MDIDMESEEDSEIYEAEVENNGSETSGDASL